MARIKKSVIVLLPVFWLVTLSYARFEPSAGARPAEPVAASSPAGDAAPDSSDFCCLSHDQLRHGARRQLAERDQEKQTLTGPPAGTRTGSSSVVTSAIPLQGESFSLQQRWQFLWRTAAPPRAPTFLA